MHVYIPQRGVQWKQGVVIYMTLYTSLLHNTTPIHCTPLRLHPPLQSIQHASDSPPGCRHSFLAPPPLKTKNIYIYIYIDISIHIHINIHVHINITVSWLRPDRLIGRLAALPPRLAAWLPFCLAAAPDTSLFDYTHLLQSLHS